MSRHSQRLARDHQLLRLAVHEALVAISDDDLRLLSKRAVNAFFVLGVVLRNPRIARRERRRA